MAKERHQLADMTADDSQGLLTNLLAEERDWSWHSLWQLGSWAVGAVGAVVLAFFAVHTSTGQRRDQVASTDLARQSQQIQWIAKESQTETRRLSSALDTLNGDRDRLFARVTMLEQGLDSVTGSVARQAAPPSLVLSSAAQVIHAAPPVIAAATATPPQTPDPVPAPAPVAEAAPATLPTVQAAATLPVAKEPAKEAAKESTKEPTKEPVKDAAKEPLPAATVYGPPDPAAPRLIETHPIAPVAAVQPEKPPGPPLVIAALPETADTDAAAGAPTIAIHRTEFGVDLGGASSIDGLRALWQGVAKPKGSPVAALRPVIVVRERRNGLGLQLRLVAGPLNDAAAAARICAVMAESDRACETTVFDGQRLEIKAAANEPSVPVVRPIRKRKPQQQVRREEPPAAAPPAAAPPPSTVSGLFRGRSPQP